MARLTLDYGLDPVEVELPAERLVAARRASSPPPLGDLASAVAAALAEPLGFPPLPRALTPDDHIAIVVNEDLSQLAVLLTPVLELLVAAQIRPEHVTVLCPMRSADVPASSWPEQLPEPLRNVRVEVHDPTDRKKLSYLASTKAGRRIYLNRNLVDADQLILVGRFDYDPVLGHAGGLADVFPGFSDEPTREELGTKVADTLPGAPVRGVWIKAQEVGWLLGLPFLIQVVAGAGDEYSRILSGSAAAVTPEGQRLLDQRWRVEVDQPAELVIATISGSTGQTFAAVTQAFAHAARVVQPGGKIVVLARATEPLSPGWQAIRHLDSLAQGLAHARQNKLPDAVSVWQLAHAAQFAKLYLHSDMPMSTVEELFMTPLEQPKQVQKLIDQAASCIVLPDGHRTLAVVKKP